MLVASSSKRNKLRIERSASEETTVQERGTMIDSGFSDPSTN